MARSRFIYIVEKAMYEVQIVAAFTVKHELISWWKKFEEQHKPISLYYYVTRVREGDFSKIEIFDIDEFVNESRKNRRVS